MGCGCKGKQNVQPPVQQPVQQPKPSNMGTNPFGGQRPNNPNGNTVQDSIRKVVERYYQKK